MLSFFEVASSYVTSTDLFTYLRQWLLLHTPDVAISVRCIGVLVVLTVKIADRSAQIALFAILFCMNEYGRLDDTEL